MMTEACATNLEVTICDTNFTEVVQLHPIFVLNLIYAILNLNQTME